MKIHLTTVFGPPLDVELWDSDLPIIIGRGDDADVSLEDRWISRVHCMVGLNDDQLFVRDLESKHGTYVNQQRVSSSELQSGDRLDVGLTTVLVESQFVDSEVSAANV